MLRGAEGFGLKHRLRTDRLLTLSEDLPLVSIAVDTRARIENLLDDVIAIKRHGLITLERASMLTGEVGAGRRCPKSCTRPPSSRSTSGAPEQTGGAPAFVAVCDLLHRRGIAGATALLGVDGTAHGVRQRARFFGRNAEVPMMIIAVGAGEQIARVLPDLGACCRRPLLTLERVRVCKRDGQLLAPPTLAARRRRAGPGHLAEADDLRLRAGAPWAQPAAPGAGPPAARERRERRDMPAGRLGLPRRPPAAWRSAAAAAPSRTDGDDHRRHARAHRPVVRDRRRD